jgi:hypothetical protein
MSDSLSATKADRIVTLHTEEAMSENPYAPPRAVLTGPRPLIAGTGTIDIRRCMQEAWRDTWANFPLWLGAGLLWLLALLAGVVSILGILLVVPVLYWGGYAFVLKMRDGDARVGDLFSGFSRYAQALVGMIGFFIVNGLTGLPAQIAVQLGVSPPERWWLVAVGYVALLATMLFVQSRLNFAPFLMVDSGYGLLDALRRSWSGTAEIKGPIALLMVLMFVATIAGMVALVVGVIPASVFAFLMWASAYRQIFGVTRAS